jgi:hydroxyacylglutathione hydrolase
MFTVTPIPAFTDNYIWAISAQSVANSDSSKTDAEFNNVVAVVDPGDADAVERYLNEHNLSLAAILITHHHNDHTGGVKTLVDSYKIPVYGPKSSPFKGITHPLEDNDQIELFDTTLTIREIPGHTLDHISYCSNTPNPQLFCGDTLFLAGCGRLFEGTARQMLNAMNYFKQLPKETEVYCTHEYSLGNLAFAAAVEPNNQAITSAIQKCTELRDSDLPTLPTSIAKELSINPFMRTSVQTVIDSASSFGKKNIVCEAEVFAAIREWKNQF